MVCNFREEWDGLALIERNGVKYINEPHAGGGNPILATTPAPNANSLTSPSQSQTIFTDMLGTSLGTVKNNAYSEIEKTAFGNLFSESAQPAESLSSVNTFFTGKPYIQELGYAFLFRNYRADMGKWLSQDIIGYPDGWNNFAYSGNNILAAIDLYGAWTIPGVLVGVLGDEQGQIILDHWLEGSGSPMIIPETDSSWSSYMKANNLLRYRISEELQKDVFNRTTSGNLNKNIHVEIQNGYTTGYEYLHGTNGGLDINGTVEVRSTSISNGSLRKIELIYDIKFTWNDIIDPNEQYEKDRLLSLGAEWFYNPKDYIIKISWNDEYKFSRFIPVE